MIVPNMMWIILLIFHHISCIKPVEMSSEYYPWVLYLFDHYVKWIIMHSHREAALCRYIARIFTCIKEDAFSMLRMIRNVLLYRGCEGRDEIQLLQYGATLDIILVLLVCVCVCVLGEEEGEWWGRGWDFDSVVTIKHNTWTNWTFTRGVVTRWYTDISGMVVL